MEPTKDTAWVYLLGVSIPVLLPLVWKLVKDWKRDKGIARLGEVMSAIHEVQEILNLLRTQLNASRVVVLRSENGGGVPSASNQVYTSIVYEAFSESADRVRDKWQRVPVDGPYVQILDQVYHTGEVELRTDDLEESSLRDLYKSTGIEFSLVRRLGVSDKAIVYLSCNFQHSEPLSPGERTILLTATAKLKRIFSCHGDVYHQNFRKL